MTAAEAEPSPYAAAADTYWRAGWRGILPLPARAKKNPPKGYTGDSGAYPSRADVLAWCEPEAGSGNVCLRMPPNVIGIDVDAYGEKPGAATLAECERQWGPLPASWRTTSRDDGISGIRLYRVPEGLAWPGELPGGAVEVIQAHHRYAVVWPSIHPDTGATYRWLDPHGLTSTTVPDLERLPPLPQPWVDGLTQGRDHASTARVDVGHQAAVGWVASLPYATDDQCTRMAKAVDQHTADLPGSAHNSTRDAVLRVARLGAEGHHGAVHALAQVRAAFMADATSPNRNLLGTHRRTPDDAAYEFSELVASAVGIVVANPSTDLTCDCFGQISSLIAPTTTTTPTTTAPPDWQPATYDVAPVVSPALDPIAPATAGVEVAPVQAEEASRFRDGASFVLDASDSVPSLWGRDDEVLWAEGEALMLVGPPGVGKTTLTGQVLRGLLGLQADVLGLPITPVGRVLYLAMDRPQQIARSLKRTFRPTDRSALEQRLSVWEGPPPGDVARHPTVLLSLAQLAQADVIVIDSLKDAAVGLSEDETAAAYNRARQLALANGVQVLEVHHMVKRGANGTKPTELADVYGSAWLTAGAGSVVLLWGAAGDPIVQMLHLKQPSAEVGPWRVEHDHAAGTSHLFHETDLLTVIATTGQAGATIMDLARTVYDSDAPTDAQRKKVERRLQRLVDQGHVTRGMDQREGYRGGKAQGRYYAAVVVDSHNGHVNGHPLAPAGQSRTDATMDTDGITAGQDNGHAAIHNGHTGSMDTAPPSIGGRGMTPETDSNDEHLKHACFGCFTGHAQAELTDGYCTTCRHRMGLV